MIKKYLPLLLVPLWLTACATSTITNLTPSTLPRGEKGLYPVECAFDTQQRTLKEKTLAPQVVVDQDSYPMRRVLKSNNRWETLVPVPAGKKEVTYHFKVDYDYTDFNKTGKGSILSQDYKLTVADK
ncbi:MAG TPA: hypothetical protein VGK40_04540 [Verrucomicrobiae bacterium]|jgi:hypothetical protein